MHTPASASGIKHIVKAVSKGEWVWGCMACRQISSSYRATDDFLICELFVCSYECYYLDCAHVLLFLFCLFPPSIM